MCTASVSMHMSREELEQQRAKHNALLKQLLSNQQALRAENQPPSTPDVSYCFVFLLMSDSS